MVKKRIHNLKRLQEYRRQLRLNNTAAEGMLWKHLKARQLAGRRFNRQHGIGNFIVDFYCAKERLVIEVDGKVHASKRAQAYDQKRTDFIESLGFRVIRFENKEVFENLIGVLEEIKACFKG